MVEKKLVALGLICVVLSVGVFGSVMVLNQKDIQMQIKTDQISGLENEKLTLETQVTTLQSETTSLNNEKNALETQFSTLQANVSGL